LAPVIQRWAVGADAVTGAAGAAGAVAWAGQALAARIREVVAITAAATARRAVEFP